jgi:hypothetical protein
MIYCFTIYFEKKILTTKFFVFSVQSKILKILKIVNITFTTIRSTMTFIE